MFLNSFIALLVVFYNNIPSFIALSQGKVTVKYGLNLNLVKLRSALEFENKHGQRIHFSHFLTSLFDFSKDLMELETQFLHHFVGFLMLFLIGTQTNNV
jgi:hypothetical protein